MNTTPLFACSRCFSRHPFEELSAGQQLCKECRGAFPVVKCTYCRSEFQQTSKSNTITICKKCEQNVKSYGKPTSCEYCNIIAAFIGNKCQRCTNSEIKYGPPVNCEQCKQKCAFDRLDDDKKVDGKLLCWLCTLSYKRALAKTKQVDAVDRRSSHMKLNHLRSSTSKHNSKDGKLRAGSGHKRPHNRMDASSKQQTTSSSSSMMNSASGDADSNGPLNKLVRNNSGGGSGNNNSLGPNIIRTDVDPNSSDHMVAMTQLKEQIASLKKQISQKDSMLLSKDKMITELKAKHFTIEQELRSKMKATDVEHDNKIDALNKRIQGLLKEVASLSKSNKRDRLQAAKNESANNSGSGTDSPITAQ